MNVSLKPFYQELQAWIEAGFPEHPAFTTATGICHNMSAWLAFHGADLRGRVRGLRLLEQTFIDAGLNEQIPFNYRSRSDKRIDHYTYMFEKNSGVLWNNKLRLDWVKKHSL